MRKRFLYLLLIFIFACGSNKNGVTVSSKIRKLDPTQNQVTLVLPDIGKMASIGKTIQFLASDQLQGRETGSLGIEMAAQFIEARFKLVGVQPYFSTYRDSFIAKGSTTFDPKTAKAIVGADANAFNIVGMISGTDPELKKEVIIIGAHYDHIGQAKSVGEDTIANGANDNATGTAMVLALADHFAKAKNNKRTLLFTLYSAEERGLLGSKHLSARLKKDGLNLYTMFNVEMVGIPMVNKDHAVYCSGYDLSNIAEKFNSYAGENVIGFLPRAKEINLFFSSDNYPFYLDFNVPSHTISSFDFTNYKHYHGVKDEVSSLDIPFMEELIKKLVLGIQGMANSETQEIIIKSHKK